MSTRIGDCGWPLLSGSVVVQCFCALWSIVSSTPLDQVLQHTYSKPWRRGGPKRPRIKRASMSGGRGLGGVQVDQSWLQYVCMCTSICRCNRTLSTAGDRGCETHGPAAGDVLISECGAGSAACFQEGVLECWTEMQRPFLYALPRPSASSGAGEVTGFLCSHQSGNQVQPAGTPGPGGIGGKQFLRSPSGPTVAVFVCVACARCCLGRTSHGQCFRLAGCWLA